MQSVNEFLLLHPSKVVDFKQMALMKVSADKTIVFPAKSELKKAIPLSSYQLFSRIAAIVIVLFSIGLLIFNGNKSIPQYSERSTIVFPVEDEIELNFAKITEPIEKSIIEQSNEPKKRPLNSE